MSFINLFFNDDVILAAAVFAVIAFVEPFLEQWLHHRFEDNPPFQLGWDYFFSPLLRSAMVVLFVYMAYPGLFGLAIAPSISELADTLGTDPNNLIGIMFLVGLILPVVPVLNRHPEFILPIQGCLAAAYLFFWLCDYLHITTASIWPGSLTICVMIVMSFVGHRMAQVAGKHLGETLDRTFETTGLDIVIRHVVELLVQVPVILAFGHGLGLQLSM